MRLLFALFLLAACASPAPQFFGAERHQVTRGGIDFIVFHKGSQAEVVRMGYLKRAQRAAVPRLMEEAVEFTTGCRVIPNSMRTRIPGDTGEARLDLDCSV
ncbi:hypothetical protein OEZ71_14630 [Defluviimonas sp. WL0050]|uniref:Lipoprotein n=1 Tax=Albidovulum litorale TaxID=2984134 RepID=A0ABT2ZQV4_9RHOB|nr:hypothetical protein [Defluviimonas sp. WL0050]MCV2873534.1 hypothetical protein [Defluviimonas sp. WL0050]